MADEPDNLVLQILRRVDAKLDRVIEDVQDRKMRVTGLEERVAHMELSVAGANRRIDRLERRLDLVDTPR
jgi:predicted  nucleic acid-binding Zn-ribbon protein